MGWMLRIGKWLLALAVIAVAVLWPRLADPGPSSGPANDPVTITDYHADTAFQ